MLSKNCFNANTAFEKIDVFASENNFFPNKHECKSDYLTKSFYDKSIFVFPRTQFGNVK